MKRVSIAIRFLGILYLFFTFSSSGLGYGAELRKARTIDELAAMYDSSSCKECHTEIWNQWEKSLHSRSLFGTGRTAATLKTTVTNGLMNWPASGVKKPQDVTVESLMICTVCHLPQLADATDAVAKEIVKNIFIYMDDHAPEPAREQAIAQIKKIDINCLICHQRNSTTHKWADGFPLKNAVYGSKDGTHPAPGYPTLKKSPEINESIMCGQCHGVGPIFMLPEASQCPTLYANYLFAYIGDEGGQETCQDCHMRKSKLGHNVQTYANPTMQKMALEFEVEVLGYQWRNVTILTPTALVKVHMTNKAGHTIPDG